VAGSASDASAEPPVTSNKNVEMELHAS
jgi:hypothetical protein